ncbi:SseB family protein [Aeromicrobium wangtongii]|uniref:SseB family protein n=1 Tax=Aeromicrobium wangtongii TaxID=2969247 RepID=A0ABY5M1W3_9ACTN|nr:SseB family protein [Aeromicrobium wangtongii]MCD9198145.1 SseB family protein [Aeromicrobium wangtongii]UUP12184.1 SseB family protein [Aeromicrobium wangtongii]
MVHGDGRSLASPQFPGDDGTVAPELAAALGDDVAVLQALPDVRVFVPIVALLGETPAEGDKNADMAAVLMTGADGRQALLAFSSIATMTAWDPKARPVPILGRDAARAALDEGASAILLDLANPSFTVIEDADVRHLAAGHRLVRSEVGPAWLSDPPS